MADQMSTSKVPVVVGGVVLVAIIGAAVYVMQGSKPAKQTSATAYPGWEVETEPVTTDSGLQYYDIVVGDGPQPEPTSKVKVNYTGYLISGTKFDSSLDDKPGRPAEPFEFSLSLEKREVIGGWLEGVATMKVGGKRKLIVPPDLAYGTSGRGSIPPNAKLVFDVELLEIVE